MPPKSITNKVVHDPAERVLYEEDYVESNEV